MNNYFEMNLKATLENVPFARSAAASFVVPLNPTVEQINDVKTAVSEAVTNCIVHAYRGRSDGEIYLKASVTDRALEIIIKDAGAGIANVEQAMTPFFTTLPMEERSGMGFTLMQTFMDSVIVESAEGNGTTLIMTKNFECSEETNA